jgi:hypothetical protein
MAQLHRLRNTALEVAQFSITPRSAGTIGERTKRERDRVGSFRPGRDGDELDAPSRADQDGERYPWLQSSSREGDEEGDGLARIDANETEERGNAGVALLMLKSAAEFLLGITPTRCRCESASAPRAGR